MNCQRAHDSAPYLLGSLSAAERRDFESHLPGCPDCTATLAELGGLPALLSRVPHDAFDDDRPQADLPFEDPLPDTLLPRLLRVVGAEQRAARRRRILIGAVASVAAVIVGAASVVIVDATRSEPATVAAIGAPHGGTEVRVTLAAEPGIEMSAYVLLKSHSWGTSLETHCTYTGRIAPDMYGPSGGYQLVVVDASGDAETVSSWQIVDGEGQIVPGSTWMPSRQISALQVTNTEGVVVASATI